MHGLHKRIEITPSAIMQPRTHRDTRRLRMAVAVTVAARVSARNSQTMTTTWEALKQNHSFAIAEQNTGVRQTSAAGRSPHESWSGCDRRIVKTKQATSAEEAQAQAPRDQNRYAMLRCTSAYEQFRSAQPVLGNTSAQTFSSARLSTRTVRHWCLRRRCCCRRALRFSA